MSSIVLFIAAAALMAFIISMSVKIVPQQNAFIIERFGKFTGSLEAGLHFLIPFVDRVAYRINLQETPIETDRQEAITRDNVVVTLDGVLYFRVTNAQQAAYNTSDFEAAIELLAQTALRSEVGKRELDKLLEDRVNINTAVVGVLDEASRQWGVKVLRYEVRDLTPPEAVREAMQMQLVAERKKRALIAQSEGIQTEKINIAEGERQAAIAASEGARDAAMNRAKGEAAAISEVAIATARALETVGKAMNSDDGSKAANLRVAEQYVAAFSNVAKQGTTVLLPANLSDMGSMLTGAMSILGVAKQK
jgi:regulator of protease activity HflC (stomatin/prohibitin superfamily)